MVDGQSDTPGCDIMHADKPHQKANQRRHLSIPVYEHDNFLTLSNDDVLVNWHPSFPSSQQKGYRPFDELKVIQIRQEGHRKQKEEAETMYLRAENSVQCHLGRRWNHSIYPVKG